MQKLTLICYLIVILSLSFVKGDCEDTKPGENKPNDCLSQSTSNDYCCYIHSDTFYHFERKCKKIAKKDYHGQREYFDEVTYERWPIDCGNPSYDKKKYETCGETYPLNPVDCWKYSTHTKSCCFYNDTKGKVEIDLKLFPFVLYNGKTECIWYKKDIGNFTKNGKTLNCNSIWIKMNYIVILFVFMLLK